MTISIVTDTAGPALCELLKVPAEKAEMARFAGRQLIEDISNHVSGWGQSHRNKLGGASSHYWEIQAGKITPENCLAGTNTGAVVTLDGQNIPGILRAVGDVTITAGTKTAGVKYLALPTQSASYGIRPREFSIQLVPFWSGKRGRIGGLAEAVPKVRQKETKRGNKGSTYFVPGLMYYWFEHSVTQPQDRTLLPSDEAMKSSVNIGAETYAVVRMNEIKRGAA